MLLLQLFQFLYYNLPLIRCQLLARTSFPQTKGLAYQIFSYIWNPIKNILVGIVDYIPNLFAILIICFAVKYLVRLLYK